MGLLDALNLSEEEVKQSGKLQRGYFFLRKQ